MINGYGQRTESFDLSSLLLVRLNTINPFSTSIYGICIEKDLELSTRLMDVTRIYPNVLYIHVEFIMSVSSELIRRFMQ